MHDPVGDGGDNTLMHDKPHSDPTSATGRTTTDLIAELTAVDPADAPDLADTIAERLESGLAPSSPAEDPNR